MHLPKPDKSIVCGPRKAYSCVEMDSMATLNRSFSRMESMASLVSEADNETASAQGTLSPSDVDSRTDVRDSSFTTKQAVETIPLARLGFIAVNLLYLSSR